MHGARAGEGPCAASKSGSGAPPGERQWPVPSRRADQGSDCGAAQIHRSAQNRQREVAAQLVVGDSKNTITLARSSADVSPPYGFMLLPGTTSSGFAMKRSSIFLSHTKSAPFMALE